MRNTVVVVEHDRDTMEAADHLVDFGPGPGTRGGQVVAEGTLTDLAQNPASVTGAYLAGRQVIEVPPSRRPVSSRPSAARRKPPRRPKA
jgi:excinuclease ABC subunit A